LRSSFQSPDTSEAPLYLDCCGLVRKVLWDLQSEFGFLIGRWNQAYQMDTLPIVLEEKDLQPGDLIFYEGKYLSSHSKPQKHDISMKGPLSQFENACVCLVVTATVV